jgi:hypothetical protein
MRDFFKNLTVFKTVWAGKIFFFIADLERVAFAQPVGLMHLKVETNCLFIFFHFFVED